MGVRVRTGPGSCNAGPAPVHGVTNGVMAALVTIAGCTKLVRPVQRMSCSTGMKTR